jgi:hypothetical protein
MIQVSTKCQTSEELEVLLHSLQKSGYVAEIKPKDDGFILYRQYREGEENIPLEGYWNWDGKEFSRNETKRRFRGKINRRSDYELIEQSHSHRTKGDAE